MAYNICTVEYHGGLLNHIAIFVRPADAAPEGGGKCFHVVGTILAGMKFEIRDRKNPLVAPDDVSDSMLLIGSVKEDDMVRFEGICKSVPPPQSQLKLNGRAKDPSKPLRRCREWVGETLEKLKEERILFEPRGIATRKPVWLMGTLEH